MFNEITFTQFIACCCLLFSKNKTPLFKYYLLKRGPSEKPFDFNFICLSVCLLTYIPLIYLSSLILFIVCVGGGEEGVPLGIKVREQPVGIRSLPPSEIWGSNSGPWLLCKGSKCP